MRMPTGGREPTFMTWKMKLIALLPMVALLQSCASNGSRNALNASAPHDPPTVTLIEGFKYPFVEGPLVGRKNHRWHSDYSYRRAIIIGGGGK